MFISENPAPGMLQFTKHPQVYPFCRSVALPKSQQGRNNCPTQTKGTEAARWCQPDPGHKNALFFGLGFAMQISCKGQAVNDSQYIFTGLSSVAVSPQSPSSLHKETS